MTCLLGISGNEVRLDGYTKFSLYFLLVLNIFKKCLRF